MKDGASGHGRDPLKHLTTGERGSVRRYLDLVAARLTTGLVQIWLYGSAARGDMWPAHLPYRSDIDLLVLSREPIAPEVREELVDATYPLYLECGRQISPQFRTTSWFEAPEDEREREFAARVRQEGVTIYPPE